MPATGRGWGGPARGNYDATRPAGPGRPRGVRNGEGKRARMREYLAPHSEAMAQRWLEKALDPQDPHAATLLVKAAEMLGEFQPSITVRGADDAPLVIRRIIVDPALPSSDTTAIEAHADTASPGPNTVPSVE
jgi:hypothetical protein